MSFAFQEIVAPGSVKELSHTLSGVYPMIQQRCLVNQTSIAMTYIVRRRTYRVVMLLSGHALFNDFIIFLVRIFVDVIVYTVRGIFVQPNWVKKA